MKREKMKSSSRKNPVNFFLTLLAVSTIALLLVVAQSNSANKTSYGKDGYWLKNDFESIKEDYKNKKFNAKTGLYNAIIFKDITAIKYFISKGAKIKNIKTPLHTAIENPNIDVLKFVVSAKTDLEEKDDIGRTTLYTLLDGWRPTYFEMAEKKLRKNVFEKLKYLIKAGANVNTTATISTDYFTAKQKVQLAKIIAKGYTTIQTLSINRRDATILKLLIENGAKDIDSPDTLTNSPLISISSTIERLAFKNQNTLLFARTLIKAGANVNYANKDGYTALHSLASGTHSIKGIKLLLKAGANLNAVDKTGKNILMYAVSTASSDERKLPEKIKQIEFLIEHKIDVNAVDNLGRTALMHTLLGRSIFNFAKFERFEVLINNGANVLIKDKKGKDVLYYLNKIPKGKYIKSEKQKIKTLITTTQK